MSGSLRIPKPHLRSPHLIPRRVGEEVRREPPCITLFRAIGGRSSLKKSAFARSVLPHNGNNGKGEIDPLARPTTDALDLKPFEAFRPSPAHSPAPIKTPHFGAYRHWVAPFDSLNDLMIAAMATRD